MAVYSKLSLGSGGGIISIKQQATQVKNTATVLIGLGGTGIDALRTIKTQVHSRLIPDNADAVRDSGVAPEYKRIRFLGVDTVKMKTKAVGDDQDSDRDNLKGTNVMTLDHREFFSIAQRNVADVIKNPRAMEGRDDLSWLRWEKIKAPSLSTAGAGGVRQVGRFMMMNRSGEFMERLKMEIKAAKSGAGDAHVNIHIFSGLSGGTGSGCFLDVCYMAQAAVEAVGGGATIFGYFFLPDVNLDKVPTSDSATRAYIPKNGYAAMQELDYCMNLQYNGGAFKQMYKGNMVIEWNRSPVDMCHLICATDSKATVRPNAYEYAMNVTAEYLMDFLTDADEQFDLSQQLANFDAKVAEKENAKGRGFNLGYCVIGAACARIPLREINTYLASHLFAHFASIQNNIPTRNDVEDVALALVQGKGAQKVNEIYDSLLREIRENANGDYLPYQDGWKSVRDDNNAELVDNYTDQTAAKLKWVIANAASMKDPNNKDSLFGRLQAQLAEVLRDIHRGPIFAHGLLKAAQDHNLGNLIEGLIKENEARWAQESAQTKKREDDYNYAKADFDANCTGLTAGLKAPKLFQAYEWYLKQLELHKLAMNVYAEMEEVLNTLLEQVEKVADSYYAKLSSVMTNLIETFKENCETLASSGVLNGTDGFAIPMMTIAELKKPLDAEVNKLNIPNMMKDFMTDLLNNEDMWINEDENKITRLVTKFFAEKAFKGFADRSITAFLQDKYNTTDVNQLTDKVFQNWMQPLIEQASPLFYFDGSVWGEDATARLSFLSIPKASTPVVNAANKVHNEVNDSWRIKSSSLTDRIYVMSSACGLPLSTYQNCAAFERAYFSESTPVGRHYYEGKPVKGMRFNDWSKLPSLTPQSLLTLSKIPIDMRTIIEPAQDLFDRMVNITDRKLFVLINDKGELSKPTEESKARLRNFIDRCDTLAKKVTTPKEAAAAEEALKQFAEMEEKGLPMEPVDYAVTSSGLVDNRRQIQKDFFVASPVLAMEMRPVVEEVEPLQADADRAVKALQDAIQAWQDAVARAEKDTQAMNAYCDALFTGVFSLEGRILLYRESQYGMTKETVLSKRDDTFPFGTIPVYQGYLSYRALPEEVQATVTQQANDLLNADAPEIRENCGKLREALRDDQVNAWSQLAAKLPQRDEIMAFLGEFMQRFQIFCLENAVN